jgi:hypothetical protein
MYRHYGALLDTSGRPAEERSAVLDRLADEVASSMLQQRERVLDLCSENPPERHRRALPREPARRGLGPRRLRAALKERFGFQAQIDEGKILDREPLEDAMWAQLETVIEAREAEMGLPMVLQLARYFYSRGDRRALDRAPQDDGGAARGHQPARLRPEGSEAGVQEGRLLIFGEMMSIIGRNVCEKLFHVQVRRDEAPPPARAKAPRRTIESGGGRPRERRQTGRRPRAATATASPRPCAARSPRSPQRPVSLRQRQEIQEMPRRPGDGLRALLALAAATAAAAACHSNTAGTGGCAFDQEVTLEASPLRVLSEVRLDRVGPGFILSGVETRRHHGALGKPRRRRRRRAGAAARALRRAGGSLAGVHGDTLLIAQGHAAANGGDAELKVVTVPITGAPTPPPGPRPSPSSRAARPDTDGRVRRLADGRPRHARLVRSRCARRRDAHAHAHRRRRREARPVDAVPPVSCLAFAPGKNAATLTYYRRPDPKITSPELVIVELDEGGGVSGTLSLFLDSHDAGCPRIIATDAGYTLAFEDSQGRGSACTAPPRTG